MRYKWLSILIIIMGFGSLFINRLFSAGKDAAGSLYDFKIKSLEGDLIDFQRFKGKNLLIVNTASKCGYTYQYADLQKLHESYGDKVTVLGFPANNFLWQEPGTNDEIATFCQKNYAVSFLMFEKVSVKGRDRHPLYSWLREKSGESPSWNFCKYVVDKNGNVIGFYGPKINPLDKKIIDSITN